MGSEAEKCTDKFLEAQVDEIEVLCSIYGDEWKTENESDRSYSIEIKENNLSVTLYVTLPKNYPYDSPPSFTISAPGMSRENKKRLSNLLEEVYLENVGQTVLFQWISKIKDYLASLAQDPDNNINVPDESQSEEAICQPSSLVPEIVHGETIVDRKSVFQGHVARVTSVNEARNVLDELKKNRKIASATHNMFAYRINITNNAILREFDDDGETHGGSRLIDLLQILDVSNVMVVVSRWYGGIQLRSARFTHISNAALKALEQAKIICPKKKIS